MPAALRASSAADLHTDSGIVHVHSELTLLHRERGALSARIAPRAPAPRAAARLPHAREVAKSSRPTGKPNLRAPNAADARRALL